MPALQVRDFPEDLYEELRACAASEQRSISQQTIVAVRDYLDVRNGRMPSRQRDSGESPSYVQKRERLFDRIHELPPFKVPPDFPEPGELIRQIRDER